jgi:F1F0 ATPase subunit 2
MPVTTQVLMEWLLAFLAGAVLGGFFFGSLWITVRQLPTTGWPIRLIMGSYLGRMAIALVGFYWISQADWQRAIAAVLGFVTLRSLILHQVQRQVPALSNGRR